MEVKAGYKKTELGVIPEEWDVVALGVLAIIERGKFSARPRNDPKYYGGETPFLQTGDIARSGGKVTTFSQTLNKEGVKVSRVFPRGTLFFTIAANIGDVGIADFPAACPDSLVAFSPHIATEKQWLLYELFRHKESFEALASPGAQLNINLEKLRPYQVHVPTHVEQRAIAQALSDVDALIAGLDRLIAKKSDIKKATMWRLINGTTRIPGFSSAWKEERLGDLIIKLRKTTRPSSAGRESGSFPFFTNTTKPVERYLDVADFDTEAIIANTGGEAYFNYYNGRFAAMSDCMVLEARINTKYLYYFLKLREQSINCDGFTGSGIKHLDKKYFRNIALSYPTEIDEQNAITSVLTDMDAEIFALEARRDKTRALKEGMMQELLTGKTRLL
jgi:type I restriction enzyme, S subunit